MKKRIGLFAAISILLAGVRFCATSQAADITWTNTAGGNWTAAANWDPNQVPGAGDTAWITNNGTYTITLDANTAIASLMLGGTTGTQTLSQTSFTLTLSGASDSSSNGVYSLSGGTLDGSGTFTLAGPFNLSALSTIGSAGSSLVLAANGGMTITGSNAKYFRGGTLINSGIASWSGGPIYCFSGTVFSNAPGATLDLLADSTAFFVASGSPALVNAGTLSKSVGVGTATISVACSNSGVVRVESGTLDLSLADSSGSFTPAAGATLSVSVNGAANLSAAASIAGPGNFTVTGGAITNYGTFATVGTNTFSGGTASFNGLCLVTNGALVINGGTVNFNGAGTVAPVSFNLSAGTLLGSMAVEVSGPFAWSGPGVLGSAGSSLVVAANGGNTFSGSSSKYFYGGTLINRTGCSWSGGPVYCYTGATVSNALGATLDLLTDGPAFSLGSGSPALVNAGTLRKTGGSGTTTVSVPCINSAALQVESGTLALSLADSSGSFTPAAGTTLSVSGVATLSAAASIAGPGNFTVTGGAITNYGTFNTVGTNTFSYGTVSFNGICLVTNGAMVVNGGTVIFNGVGAVAPASLDVSMGTLLGSMAVEVSGPFNWTGNGGLGSAGSSLVVAINGGLTINGSYGKYFYGGTLINNSTGSWSGGALYCSSSALFSNAPGATFDLTTDGTVFNPWSGSPSLVNAGTLRKTGGTGVSLIGVDCNNSGVVQANSGTLSFGRPFLQNAGQTLLNGGTFAFAQTAQLRGGKLAGSGTVTGSVSNNATVSPGASPGLLTITGNYTESANAHLQIELGGTTPGADHDQLAVGGSAALAGTLDLSYWNGFTPSSGNVFTVLVCNARSGGFSAIQSPAADLATLYTAKSVLVEPGNASPIAHLTANPVQLACHTFRVSGAATDPDGTVTNLTLLLDTNVLISVPGASAQAAVSYDFPGQVTLTALATDHKGAMGAANLTVTIGTLPALVLDPIGFQTNRAFKLCMCGEAGTNYQVLVSTNLAATNWTVLGVMQSTNGIWRYTDNGATNSAQRYYRAQRSP